MGGLTPIGAIGLGSYFLEYTNYIPTQARATFADVPGLEVRITRKVDLPVSNS